MAFKDCFYLQFLKDEDPGIDFNEADFNWQPDALKVDMYYGYEKPDGSEPTWVKIGFNANEVHHIDVTIGQKIYFKGTMPIGSLPWGNGRHEGRHHNYHWFCTYNKKSNTILKIGGCPMSLLNDGDGSQDGPGKPEIEGRAVGFACMFLNFPGYLFISDLILPTNANIPSLFHYIFQDVGHIRGITRKLFPKHKLAAFEYVGFFQGTNIKEPIWLPFEDSDIVEPYCLHALICQSDASILHVKFTTWRSATQDWVKNNTAATGNFYCPDELPIRYDISYIPSGWTVNPDRTSQTSAILKKYIYSLLPPY